MKPSVIIGITLSFILMGTIPASANESIHAAKKQQVQIEHGGRTDKNGCHRDKKAGTTHCH